MAGTEVTSGEMYFLERTLCFSTLKKWRNDRITDSPIRDFPFSLFPSFPHLFLFHKTLPYISKLSYILQSSAFGYTFPVFFVWYASVCWVSYSSVISFWLVRIQHISLHILTVFWTGWPEEWSSVRPFLFTTAFGMCSGGHLASYQVNTTGSLLGQPEWEAGHFLVLKVKEDWIFTSTVTRVFMVLCLIKPRDKLGLLFASNSKPYSIYVHSPHFSTDIVKGWLARACQ